MRLGRILLPLLTLLMAGEALALQPVYENGDVKLTAGFLLQAQGAFMENEAPSGADWGKDFFLRRARFMLGGQLTNHITFFMETDQPNLGKNNNWSAPLFIQDAFVNFKVVDAFIVDVGMLLVPFTHHVTQGAGNLLTLDYHTHMAKYPAGSTLVWRDMGVQFRGYVLDNALTYRLAILNGLEGVAGQVDANGAALPTLNETDMPRIAGSVRYYILGSETGFFLGGHYYLGDSDADKAIVSVGGAFDFQPDAVLAPDGKVAHYMAFGGDVFVDMPLAVGQELVFQANAAYYNYGEKAANTGLAMFGEAGYRFRQFMPVVGFDYFKSDADNKDWQRIQAGLTFFIKKHSANVKALFQMDKLGDGDYMKGALVQLQFLL